MTYSKKYKIVYTEEAVTAIKKLPHKRQHQIKQGVKRIAQNPELDKHLTHELKGLLSYRSGDYRIIYRIYYKEILIIVLTVGHRIDVYKIIRRDN